MEKVKVVRPVSGILNVGDVLISPISGADFCLEEVSVTKAGSNERYVSLDYVTVSENVPQFFVFDTDAFELVFTEEDECEECDECHYNDFARNRDSVDDRYEFFKEKFEQSEPGSEAQVVYRNLMWFIEWLYGKAEIL